MRSQRNTLGSTKKTDLRLALHVIDGFQYYRHRFLLYTQSLWGFTKFETINIININSR